jgi:FkbM family methyltransferase
MPLLQRAVGAASRRLGRPELLAAVSPAVRRSEHEAVAINAILASALPGARSYVDVGTNRGQVLREAVRVAPQGRHMAFEPIPALAEEVKQAFPQVDCRQLALGARPGESEFCHFTTLDGWSGLRRSPQVSDTQGHPRYIRVKVSTLDEEITQITPSVIKIDVEGAELAVLEGGRRLLSEVRPLLIIEHVAEAAGLYDASSQAVWDLLAELDYALFAVTGEGPLARSDFAAASVSVNWLATSRRPPAASTAER